MSQPTTMSIARALRRVKALKGKLSELTARAAKCVSYEESKPPAFDFNQTREQANKAREELIELEAALTYANATNEVVFEDNKLSLAKAIRTLQEFKGEIAWLSDLTLKYGNFESRAEDWDEVTGRRSCKTVITVFKSALQEPQRVEEIDKLKARFAQLNDLVEEANHRATVEVASEAVA